MSDKIHDQTDKRRRLNFKSPDPVKPVGRVVLRHGGGYDPRKSREENFDPTLEPSKYFAGPPPNGKTANQRIAELAKPNRAKAKTPATQHRCGHPLEEGRKPKKRCTACVAATHDEEAKAHADATARGRLPHGSRFDVQWDAEKEQWIGTLVIPGELPQGMPCGTVIAATARGVFPLLAKLDKLYRKGATK